MMDLATATPAEIDGQLAKVWTELYPLLDERDGYGREAAQGERRQAVLDRIEALRAVIKPLEAQWSQRGYWARYYRVDRADGHVHSSKYCSTCGPRTQYRWLHELAAKTEPEMIAELGPDAWLLCTVCFPTAPVLPKPVRDDLCDGTPAPGQGTRINKRCSKCQHVGVARHWRRHKAK